MMRSQSRHKRAALPAIRLGALLAISIGLAGCSWWEALEPGENFADKYGELVGFCGLLQDCGSDSDANRGGSQTAIGSFSNSSTRGSRTNDGVE